MPRHSADALTRLLAERIVVLDGAMGTQVQALRLTDADYRGERFADWPVDLKGLHDLLVPHGAGRRARDPPVVPRGRRRHHRDQHVQRDVDLAGRVRARRSRRRDQPRVGAPRARSRRMSPSAPTAGPASSQACSGRRAAPRRCRPTYPIPRFARSPSRACATRTAIAASGLIDGGADILLVETIFDTLNAKAAIAAIEDAFDAFGGRLPVILSGTITDRSGRTLSGQTPEAFWISVEHMSPVAVGLNCALGPAELRPHLAELSRVASVPVSAHPNAGLPNDLGDYDMGADEMAGHIGAWAADGLVNLVGGCCGSTPEHVRAIAEAVRGRSPRVAPARIPRLRVSGLEAVAISKESGFCNVGERTNVTGSAHFARLVRAGDGDAAVAVARAQVESGAQMIDVNMDDGLLESSEEMRRFLNLIAAEPSVSRVPIMIDSSKFEVIEAGLECVQGKAIVNSLSLKDGEERFVEHARRVRRHGAAIVVMAFDEQGQADTVERKVEILTRAYGLLVDVVGVPPSDLILDPCILTIGTGMAEHDSYGVAFIEATRLLHDACPGALVSGGLSNLSFAFRGHTAVREAIHAVFLYHAIHAGLDMAIVNPAALMQYDDIPHELREIVEDLVLNRRPDATDRLLDAAASVESGPAVAVDAQEWRSLPGRRPPRTRARRGHRRLRRRRHRGGATGLRAPDRGDRGTAHARHGGGRRSLPGRPHVPTAGGQERARHEAVGGAPGAVHRGRARHERRPRCQGHDRDGDRQGRRPRHRQEHRRRRARVQRLPRRRSRRDDALRRHHRGGATRERRPDRPLRTDHAEPRGDGVRRVRAPARADHHAAPDRRRDDQQGAHRAAHRPEARRSGRLRHRREPGDRRRVDAPERRPPRGVPRDDARRVLRDPRSPRRQRHATHHGGGGSRTASRRRLARDRGARAVRARDHDVPRLPARRSDRVHRLDAVLPDVGARRVASPPSSTTRRSARPHAICTRTRSRSSR